MVQMLAVHKATRICVFEWLDGGSLEMALQGDGERMGGDIGRLEVIGRILSSILELRKLSVILGDIKVRIFRLLLVKDVCFTPEV